MSATTTQTIRLLDCPVCGEPIELAVTYDVRLREDLAIRDLRSAEKVVTATLKATGSHVKHHICPLNTFARSARED